YFSGAMDEIRIWNGARTTADIAHDKNRRLFGGYLGLVCYWRLDDGAGLTALGASGFGHNGRLFGNAVWAGSRAPLLAQLRLCRLGDGTVQLPLIGYPSKPYVFSASPDLIEWLPFGTNATSADGRAAIIDRDASRFPTRFYRAILR